MNDYGLTFRALKDGEIIEFTDQNEWAAYNEAHPDNCIVKHDRIAGAFLSTVLLPFPVFSDLGGRGDVRPFETMVFYGPEDQHARVMMRYPTYADALAAHEACAGCLRVLEKENYEVNEAAIEAIWRGVFEI